MPRRCFVNHISQNLPLSFKLYIEGEWIVMKHGLSVNVETGSGSDPHSDASPSYHSQFRYMSSIIRVDLTFPQLSFTHSLTHVIPCVSAPHRSWAMELIYLKTEAELTKEVNALTRSGNLLSLSLFLSLYTLLFTCVSASNVMMTAVMSSAYPTNFALTVTSILNIPLHRMFRRSGARSGE